MTINLKTIGNFNLITKEAAELEMEDGIYRDEAASAVALQWDETTHQAASC